MNSLDELIKNRLLISFFSYYHLNIKNVTVWNKVERVDVELNDNSKVCYSFQEVDNLIKQRLW